MKTQKLFLALAVSLLGCGYMRSLFSHQVSLEEDMSIVFPQFFAHAPVEVGVQGEPYKMDGEMLRALIVASNDFLPSDAKNLPCPQRKEAQHYRMIRQGNIIFVYIYENHTYCGRKYPALDSGVKYAISTDGRILRRLFDGQPERPIEPEKPDDSGRWIRAEPGVSLTFDPLWNQSRDGGTAPPNPPSPPAPPPGTDGGASFTETSPT